MGAAASIDRREERVCTVVRRARGLTRDIAFQNQHSPKQSYHRTPRSKRKDTRRSNNNNNKGDNDILPTLCENDLEDEREARGRRPGKGMKDRVKKRDRKTKTRRRTTSRRRRNSNSEDERDDVCRPLSLLKSIAIERGTTAPKKKRRPSAAAAAAILARTGGRDPPFLLLRKNEDRSADGRRRKRRISAHNIKSTLENIVENGGESKSPALADDDAREERKGGFMRLEDFTGEWTQRIGSLRDDDDDDDEDNGDYYYHDDDGFQRHHRHHVSSKRGEQKDPSPKSASGRDTGTYHRIRRDALRSVRDMSWDILEECPSPTLTPPPPSSKRVLRRQSILAAKNAGSRRSRRLSEEDEKEETAVKDETKRTESNYHKGGEGPARKNAHATVSGDVEGDHRGKSNVSSVTIFRRRRNSILQAARRSSFRVRNVGYDRGDERIGGRGGEEEGSSTTEVAEKIRRISLLASTRGRRRSVSQKKREETKRKNRTSMTGTGLPPGLDNPMSNTTVPAPTDEIPSRRSRASSRRSKLPSSDASVPDDAEIARRSRHWRNLKSVIFASNAFQK